MVAARRAGNGDAFDRRKAQLGEHPPGGRVVDEVGGGKPRQTPIAAAVRQYRTGRLGGIALTPPRLAQPEAELGDAGGTAVIARAADQLAAVADDGKAHLAARRLQPGQRLFGIEGMGNVAGHRSDRPVAGEAGKLGRIGGLEGPQQQALGGEREHEASVARVRRARSVTPHGEGGGERALERGIPPGYSAAPLAAGRTDTNTRPLRLVANSTLPSVRANKVWSVPMPTLEPGCQRVPRCRTRMLPASTRSPPYRLMPRRRPAVSRPLREEPPAFLCAMGTILELSRRSDADDVLDANGGFVLAVAPLAPRVLAPPLFESDNFGGASLFDDFGGYLGAGNGGGAELGRVAAEHQHLAEFDGGASLAGHLFDLEHIVRGDAVLLAAGLNDSVHGNVLRFAACKGQLGRAHGVARAKKIGRASCRERV